MTILYGWVVCDLIHWMPTGHRITFLYTVCIPTYRVFDSVTGLLITVGFATGLPFSSLNFNTLKLADELQR